MIDEAQIVPYQTRLLPFSKGPWLVFAPHADDETFGMGGTIALASAQGIAVELVVVTDGALGGSGDRDALVLARQAEALHAAEMLGIRKVHFLGQPDRGLANTDPLQKEIVKLIQTTGSACVYFPGPLELHPDHRTCALVVWDSCRRMNDSALELISYEITVQNPVNCLVDITSTQALKTRALASYHSQVGENNYAEVVAGLNVLRTLTLGTNVQAAEGFYQFSLQERATSLPEWLAAWVGKLLD